MAGPQVVGGGSAVSTGDKGITRIPMPIPLPCITILIHGVNDVGEAYSAQEIGLCRGLNARLNRSHSLDPKAQGDLIPAEYRMPPASKAEEKNETAKDRSDPDAVYFHRSNTKQSWSPIIPFYWGSREADAMIKKNLSHGQWVDRYGNRLDKHGAKNGGSFANATNDFYSMWGKGFDSKMMDSKWLAAANSTPTHHLVNGCPRVYMVFAAKRMAMLITMIRKNPDYKDVAINILAHSQGTMVSLLAHAMLADQPEKFSVDTLIMQNSPYSFEETFAEWIDEPVRDRQQTTGARVKTFSNIIQYINSRKVTSPALATLRNDTNKGVVGPAWQPGPGGQQYIDKKPKNPYPLTERDNRGKVYLYFTPHDQTVSLRNVQGIGWQGVPNTMQALIGRSRWEELKHKRHQEGDYQDANISVFDTINIWPDIIPGFHQRVFTDRKINGQPAILVGEAPTNYEMRSSILERPATGGVTHGLGGSARAEIAPGTIRRINGERLDCPIAADLHAGEAGHPGELSYGIIDATIAVGSGAAAESTDNWVTPDFRTGTRRGASPLTQDELQHLENILPGQNQNSQDIKDVANRFHIVSIEVRTAEGHGLWCTYTTETPNQVQERLRYKNDGNSYHSAIPANPDHAAWVTAYDLSIAKPLPLPVKDEESGLYLNPEMEYWRAVADWRTDWRDLQKSKNFRDKKIIELFSKEEPKAFKLINNNFEYYSSGKLPADIVDSNEKVTVHIPKKVMIQSLAERDNGTDLYTQDLPSY